MASKRRVNWISQQRVDVPDVRAVESAVSNDFDELLSAFVTGINQGYILRGFKISMAGAIGGAASGLQLIVDPGAVFHGASSQSGTFYLVPSGTPAQQLNSATNTIVDGAFSPSAINYVSLEYERFIDDTTSAQVYLWNPTTNNETTKTVPRAQILRYRIRITTATPASNYLPIAIVTTDSGNNVTRIDDARYNLFSQGKGGFNPDPFNRFTFTQGRDAGPTFSTSNSVNPFEGGDKAIGNMKEWMDAVTTSIQEIKGTTYWTSLSSSGSLESIRTDLGNTIITGRGNISHDAEQTTPGLMNWSEDIHIRVIGSRLAYRLVANPTSTDVTLADNQVAYITLVRGVTVVPNLVFINGSKIVTSVGAVAWTGPLQSGDWIKLGSDTDAGYYQIDTVDSLTQVTLLENYGGSSTGPSGAKAKYAFGSYQSSPTPSSTRDIYIADREDVPAGENVFWLFARNDSAGTVARVYVRFLGMEIEDGETEEISDNVPLQLLQYIGSPMESASKPQYESALNPGSVPFIEDLTFGTAAQISQNDYFFISSAGNYRSYYVWFNKDGGGTDPEVPGRIGIEVPIATGMTNIQVASAVATALVNEPYYNDFVAATRPTPNQMVVRVTRSSAGATVASSDFNLGAPFAVATVQVGTGIGNYVIADGDSLTLAIKKLDRAVGGILEALDSPSYDEPMDVVTGTATQIAGVNDIFGSMITTWSSATRYAQAFVPNATTTLEEVVINLRKVNIPNFELIAEIWTDVAGAPGVSLAAATNSLQVNTLGTIPYTAFTYTFAGLPVTNGTTYWVVLRTGTFVASDPLEFQASQTYAPGVAQVSINNGTSYSPLSFPLRFAVNSAAGVGPNEIAGPVSSGTIITIPPNSRMGSVQQKYTVGRGTLLVFLNGQYLRLGIDWDEVGAAESASEQIEILMDLPLGDVLEFRISAAGGGAGGGGGIGPQGPVGPQGPPGQDALGGPVAISTKTGNYTVLLSDKVLKGNCVGADITFTLPPASTAAGRVFYFKKIDNTAFQVFVVGDGGELIDGLNSQPLSVQYEGFMVVCDGTSWSLF